jgi:hypothetical protein
MIGVATEALNRYAVSTQPTALSDVWRALWICGRAGTTNDCRKVSEVMDGVEEDLLDGLEPAERDQLEGLLTSIWERSGGYEAWSQVATDADDKAA